MVTLQSPKRENQNRKNKYHLVITDFEDIRGRTNLYFKCLFKEI